MTDYQKTGYLLEDYRLFHLRSDSGIRPDYHYHEFSKILLLVSGSGSYVVDGQRYSIRSGDAVLIGSGCVHRPEFEVGVAYERIILYISPEFLQRQSVPECDLRECFNGQHGHVLRADEAQQKVIFQLAASLEKELSGSDYGREILSNSLLLRLLVQISRNLRKNREQTGLMEPKNDRVLKLIRYMDAHLAEDISIDALAEQVYLSKYHMMRLFRKETGITVHDYLTQRRLLLARDHIRSGLSATDACYRSGWRSYSSFTRAYAKQFGTTPTGRRDTAARQEETYE